MLLLALVPVRPVRAVDAVTSTGGALYASTSADYTWVEKTWYSPNGWQILKAHFKMQGRPHYAGYSYTYDYGYLYYMRRGTSSWSYWGSWNYLNGDFWVDFAASGYDVIALKVAISSGHSHAGGTAWADVPEVLLRRPPFDPGKPVLGGGSPSQWNVRVSWSANSNPSGTQYELWRKTVNPDGSVAEDKAIYSGTATEFTTTDQASGKYYLYRVRAYYDGMWSNFSPETSYWTAPGISSATPGAGSITVSWPKVRDGLTYRVWWRPEGGSWQSATTTALSYTISGLSPLVRYGVALSAVLSEGGNEWQSDEVFATPLAYAPGAGSLSATQTSLTASWTANGNPSGVQYFAELRNQGGSVLASSGWTTALSYTFSGLSPGTPYRVYVKAKNAAGVETAWTYLGERYTAPPDVTTLSGECSALDWSNSAGRGWVKLTWQPVQGATGYKVYVFDGNAYRAFDVGSRTYWDSREEKIYPPESVLDSYSDNAVSSDLFRHDKSGLDLRDTPNKLYRKTVGTAYDSANNYWFRVTAYNASGESSRDANLYQPTLPNRTDTQAPAGSVVVNEDQMVAGGASVTLRITASDPAQPNHTSDPSDDASGVAWMRFSNDGTNWQDWVPYQETYQWKLDTSTFGKKTVYGQVKDAAGNVSATFSDEIFYYLVDAQAPQVSLVINGGADATSSPQVQLEVKAQDDLTPATGLQARFSNDFSSWTDWGPYQPYRSWALPSGDGTKTVYVQVKDQSGNIGTAYARIALKTSGGGVQSAPGVFWSDSGYGGAAYFTGQAYQVRFVTGAQVGLRLNAPGASYVQYSLDGMKWLAAEPVLPQKTFTLPDWEGHKTVYARLPDGSVYVVHFVLDRTPPDVQAGWLGGATVAPGGRATLVLDARDNFTRREDLQVSVDGGATWRSYAAQIPVTLGGGSGYRTVLLVVKDQAGNAVQRTLGIFVP
ncbi:MAG: fibronectin type III domain-containing protein [Bacillota bacterium]